MIGIRRNDCEKNIWSILIFARRFVKELPTAGRWMLRGIAAFIAGYGVYAFIRREIGHYMFLQNQYVFFDFEEPLIFFLADYVAARVFFIWISHYFSRGLKHIWQRKTGKQIITLFIWSICLVQIGFFTV